MITNKSFLCFMDKQKSLGAGSDSFKLNLNQNVNKPFASHDRSQSSTLTLPYKFEKNGKIQTWHKSSAKYDNLRFLSYESAKYDDLCFLLYETTNCLDNEKNLSLINTSTLSLHIAEYENSIEDVSSDTNGNKIFKMIDVKKKSELLKQNFTFVELQNSLEIPRQRRRQPTRPEVMQFRASQRLLNPNSSYQSSKDKKQHLRHFMRIIFDKNPNVTGYDMQKEIADTYPDEAPSVRTCWEWIRKFKSDEDNNLKDDKRSGRPEYICDDLLRAYVIENSGKTVKMIADHFGCGTGTISRHLNKIGFVHKFGKWLPHRLSPANTARRLEVATDLLGRSRSGRLNLDHILTCDEKWVVYDNVIRRRQWVPRGSPATPTARAPLHQRKLLLCFFWDSEGKFTIKNV